MDPRARSAYQPGVHSASSTALDARRRRASGPARVEIGFSSRIAPHAAQKRSSLSRPLESVATATRVERIEHEQGFLVIGIPPFLAQRVDFRSGGRRGWRPRTRRESLPAPFLSRDVSRVPRYRGSVRFFVARIGPQSASFTGEGGHALSGLGAGHPFGEEG